MEARQPAGFEIEWQLEAQDLRPVLRWLEHDAANGENGISVARGTTHTHVDTYVDTADRRLDRSGYSVRLRRASKCGGEATLKSLEDARPDALRIRLEVSQQVDADNAAAIPHLRGPVGDRVRALVGTRKLIPLFDLQTRRRTFPLATADGPSGELLLDETAIREPGLGRILSRLRRVEVEVPETAIGTIGPLVERLQRDCGLQPAILSKYEAALAATGNHRTELETFGPTLVDAEATIGHVALAVLRGQFAALLANEPGTRLGDDIEDLHAMRVASRRLRAAIAFFQTVLPVEAAQLRPDLAWIGQAIGAVRDLDVQLAQLDEWAELSPEVDRAAVAPLRALLRDQRADARAKMLLALDSPRYERLVRRFGRMLRARSGARTAPARAAAPELVLRRHRKLRGYTKGVARGGDPDAYHQLRIAAKRFRYALEFLSDVYPGETQALVRRTVALQDLLGGYQDAHVATARLRHLATERAGDLGASTIFAMGEMAERYHAAMEHTRPQVPSVARKLNGKAWKRLRKRLDAARPQAPIRPLAPR